MKGRQIIICALILAFITFALCHKPKEGEKPNSRPAAKKSSPTEPTSSKSSVDNKNEAKGKENGQIKKEDPKKTQAEVKDIKTEHDDEQIKVETHNHKHGHQHGHSHSHGHHHHSHDHKHDHEHEHDHDHDHKDEKKEAISETKHHHDGHHHHHHHHHHHDSAFTIKSLEEVKKWLNNSLFAQLSKYSSEEQSIIGACIISLIPIPILLLIVILGLRQNYLLKILSSLALGALLGDVLFHNLSELFASSSRIHFTSNQFINILLEKEMMIVYGIVFMILIEKIIPDYGGHNHDHVSGSVKDKCQPQTEEVSSSEIAVTFINDFTHNFTDGIAIAVSFNISLELGVSTLVALILHEIPHEIADFTYLFRKKKSIIWSLFNQIFASFGCFLGVILSKFPFNNFRCSN